MAIKLKFPRLSLGRKALESTAQLSQRVYLIGCNDKTGSSIFVPTPNPGAKMSYPTIFISGLGSTGLSCAIVNVEKDNISSPMATTVISKGYNVGGSALGVLHVSCIPPSNSIEREIKVSY